MSFCSVSLGNRLKCPRLDRDSCEHTNDRLVVILQLFFVKHCISDFKKQIKSLTQINVLNSR